MVQVDAITRCQLRKRAEQHDGHGIVEHGFTKHEGVQHLVALQLRHTHDGKRCHRVDSRDEGTEQQAARAV